MIVGSTDMFNLTTVTIAYGITTHTYSMDIADTFEQMFYNVSKVHNQLLRFQFDDADVKPQHSLSSLLLSPNFCQEHLTIYAFKSKSTQRNDGWIYRPLKAIYMQKKKKGLVTIKKRQGVKYDTLPLAECITRLATPKHQAAQPPSLVPPSL
jgi:hypothetical protein